MSQTRKRTAFDVDSKVRTSPPIWPERELEVQPGDLSQFASHGTSVYGYQAHDGNNPFTSAPEEAACGGVIYFDNNISKADFQALMRIANVQPSYEVNPQKDFAVFTNESKQPGQDGYLAQMRLVSKFGLQFMFKALLESEYHTFPDQPMTMVEALWLFIEVERKRWGTSFRQDRENGLEGVFGGDGDSAREQLSFGFMVENSYHHVYRIWSRAWLVTK